ncbi:MAG: DUF222 domain-containing protein, partial [Mycobacterium sp.]
MFEVSSLPQVLDVVSGDDAELLAAIGDACEFENATLARRMWAMVELYDRRQAAATAANTELWAVDCTASVITEIAAEQRTTRGRAETMLDTALTLRRRFPLLNAKFLAGTISYRVLTAIIARTRLIDDSMIALVEREILKALGRLGRLSDKKLAEQIDYWVMEIDYLAVRAKRNVDTERGIDFDVREDGMTDLIGTMRTPDAALLDARLDQLADTVCPRDPRTKDNRRADAAAALAAGHTRLQCECRTPDCPQTTTPQDTLAPIVINMIADEATVNGTGSKPAILPGFGPLRADVLHDMTRNIRVRFRTIHHPRDAVPE